MNNKANGEFSVNISRRSFVEKSATAVAALSIAPGVLLNQVHAKPADEAVTDAKRWGILIDTAKCGNGCTDCVTACNLLRICRIASAIISRCNVSCSDDFASTCVSLNVCSLEV